MMESSMSAPRVGEKAIVGYSVNSESVYILHLEVLATNTDGQFTGRIERIFSAGIGEVTGGAILTLIGQEKAFGAGDLIAKI